MTTELDQPSRRNALKCVAFGGAGTLFALAGGVLTPVDLAFGKERNETTPKTGTPLFVQISDSHIGFDKLANPDVTGTLKQTIDRINALSVPPKLVIHTGDITHFSKADQFDTAKQLFGTLRVPEFHTVPGEHDVFDGGTEYFNLFGRPSNNKGYYSFDHDGVHFVGLLNVLNYVPGGLHTLGNDQLNWLKSDLQDRSSSTPIVVFAHYPMWTIYEPWDWGTGDADQALSHLKRFGSVTVVNGHVHQIVQRVEGNITFHTARGTAYPIAPAGVGPGPQPLKVPATDLPTKLGFRSVTNKLKITDTTLG